MDERQKKALIGVIVIAILAVPLYRILSPKKTHVVTVTFPITEVAEEHVISVTIYSQTVQLETVIPGKGGVVQADFYGLPQEDTMELTLIADGQSITKELTLREAATIVVNDISFTVEYNFYR